MELSKPRKPTKKELRIAQGVANYLSGQRQEALRRDFKYHTDHGLDLPLLVLAINHRDGREPPRFAKGREFIRLAHQTAGMICNQHYLFATVLAPRPMFRLLMLELNNRWLDTSTSSPAPLDSVLEYRESLKGQGLDCDDCYHEFEEGFYPIHLDRKALAKVCSDRLPRELDELLILDKKDKWMLGVFGYWRLYVLGANCD